MQSFASRIKNAIEQDRNEVDILQLAVDLASTETTIKHALNWLAARGVITFTNLSPEVVRIVRGGTPDYLKQSQLDESMRQRFRELQAFTRYLKNVDLDKLTSELG